MTTHIPHSLADAVAPTDRSVKSQSDMSDALPHEVLLVEDHKDIAELVCDFLESNGLAVDYAADGREALFLIEQNTYDAVVLDLSLPKIDGVEVCKAIRRHICSDVPILMLTARDTLANKLEGLDAGADDYVVKPFELEEVLARITALIRRHRGNLTSAALQVDGLLLNVDTLEVRREGEKLGVTPTGFAILRSLMHVSPAVLTRQDLERAVWGDRQPDSDALRSHIYQLRKIVDRPFAWPLLHTVSGIGFWIGRGDDQ